MKLAVTACLVLTQARKVEEEGLLQTQKHFGSKLQEEIDDIPVNVHIDKDVFHTEVKQIIDGVLPTKLEHFIDDVLPTEVEHIVDDLVAAGKLSRQGEKGDAGQDGVHGVDGRHGKDGEHGEDGDDGEGGVNGTHGKDGADGEDGMDGQDGSHGKDGEAGTHGTDGKHGEDGMDGEDGKDGMHGQKGKDGQKGDKGQQGQKGQKGDQGQKGDKGEKGAKTYGCSSKPGFCLNTHPGLMHCKANLLNGGLGLTRGAAGRAKAREICEDLAFKNRASGSYAMMNQFGDQYCIVIFTDRNPDACQSIPGFYQQWPAGVQKGGGPLTFGGNTDQQSRCTVCEGE